MFFTALCFPFFFPGPGPGWVAREGLVWFRRQYVVAAVHTDTAAVVGITRWVANTDHPTRYGLCGDTDHPGRQSAADDASASFGKEDRPMGAVREKVYIYTAAAHRHCKLIAAASQWRPESTGISNRSVVAGRAGWMWIRSAWRGTRGTTRAQRVTNPSTCRQQCHLSIYRCVRPPARP
ncbi:hypothetical protein BS78_07G145100 [Paspalum vaginatum]|nr:hypothetical protein BS78_07G145100 [Paspalum vaginatum]